MTADAIAVPLPAVAAQVDVRAFVEREAPGILAYFARRADRDDAADLLGETLVVVWRRVATIPSDETRARMWLYGVARNVLSQHRRATVRRTALAEKLRLDLGALPATVDPTEHDEVRAQIATLPRVDREIIELVYWEGFSLVEVAGILGMRQPTVRSRHARARATLRAALES